MATYFGSILCKIFALCFALRFVSSCREVFLTVPLVDVRDCLSNCERDSRCSTYYFKGSASGRSTCALSEFGLQTKHGGYQGLARVLTRLRDDGPWDEQIAQQIRPALKDNKDCNQDKTSDRNPPEDYCAAGKHNCSINANCTVAAGTFKCSCTDGYQGDGVICDRACKLGWHLFEGSCYHVYTETKLWQDSSLACQSNQANLVSITSLQENNFVHSLIRSAVVSAVWIGLARSGSPSTLSWSDGSTLSYNNWYRNEPDSSGDCVYMRTRDSKWLDESCTFTLGFVCKS